MHEFDKKSGIHKAILDNGWITIIGLHVSIRASLHRLDDIYIGKRQEASVKARVVQESDFCEQKVNKGLRAIVMAWTHQQGDIGVGQ